MTNPVSDQEFAQSVVAGLKNEYDRVARERDAAVARAERAEARLKRADTLLFMAETALGPRTVRGRERICAVGALMHAMREAGYEVDPA